VRLLDAGGEERVEVEPAADDDPQQEVADRAQVVERVGRFAERAVEHALDREEHGLAGAVEESQHRLGVSKRGVTAGEEIPATGGGMSPGPGTHQGTASPLCWIRSRVRGMIWITSRRERPCGGVQAGLGPEDPRRSRRRDAANRYQSVPMTM